jgi:hypothetical protein
VEASDWDEGDEPRPDPYLPPEERWWRHPSELGGPVQPLPVARPALLTAPGGGRVALALAVAIGAAGAVLAAYVAHLAQPATEEVATTVVRVTAATTAPVVTVASTVPPSAVPGVVQLVMPSGSSKRNGTAAAVTNGQLVTSAKMVGSNRIVQGGGIVHVLGDPDLPQEEEKKLRNGIESPPALPGSG